MRRRFFVLTVVALSAGAIMVAASLLYYARGDYALQLPNGYELIRTNASTLMIWTPQGADRQCVVPPKITKVGGSGDVVFGYVQKDPAADAGYEQVEGFFILNTKSGEVSTGLAKGEWLRALATHAIREDPRLQKPSRWFKLSE